MEWIPLAGLVWLTMMNTLSILVMSAKVYGRKGS